MRPKANDNYLDHELRVEHFLRLLAGSSSSERGLRHHLFSRAVAAADAAECDRLARAEPPRFVALPVYREGRCGQHVIVSHDLYEVRLGPRGGRQERRWQKGNTRWINWRTCNATAGAWKKRDQEVTS